MNAPKNFIEELKWRRMLHDAMPGTEELLMKGNTAGYIGFDPTADSLGVGNLVQVMTLLHFQQCGHTPIALIGEAPLVLLANAKLPIKSINDLVALGKTKPDAIRFASSGNGSSSHLAMDVLRHMTGMQYLHIPYRGGGPALIDVMSGEVDVTMLPISESMPYVRDGRVVALGQTGVTRSTIAKDMPTIEEAGVKGYASTTWYMVLGPANLPANVVSFMQTQLANVLQMPDLRDRVQAAGVNIINGDSAKAKAFLDEEYKKWAALIKASGTVIE